MMLASLLFFSKWAAVELVKIAKPNVIRWCAHITAKILLMECQKDPAERGYATKFRLRKNGLMNFAKLTPQAKI